MPIGGVPLDGTPFNKVNTFHDALVICYYILAGLGLLYSTVCLVFNFTQRNKRLNVYVLMKCVLILSFSV